MPSKVNSYLLNLASFKKKFKIENNVQFSKCLKQQYQSIIQPNFVSEVYHFYCDLMLKLKLQYFGHLTQELTHWKKILIQGRLKANGEGGSRRRNN